MTLERRNMSSERVNNAVRNLCDGGYLLEEEDYYIYQS